MAQTIFKLLSNIESDIKLDRLKGLDDYTKLVVKKFISFIESGCYTNSLVEKFIATNFRLNATEITNKWNSESHGSTKSDNTFRSQISTMSNYILSIFTFNVDELNKIVVTNDSKSLERIESIIDAFKVADVDISNRFRMLKTFIPEDVEVKIFNLDECQSELELLKTFDEENIAKYLDGIDMEKLLFLINLCSQSLIDTEYVELINHKSKVRKSRLNENKLKFCKYLINTESCEIKPVEYISVEEDNAMISNDTEENKVVIKEDSVEPLYNLGLSAELSKILESYIKNYDAYAASVKNANENRYMTYKVDDKHKNARNTKKEVENFLRLLTPEGFKEYLMTLNPFILKLDLELGYMDDKND